MRRSSGASALCVVVVVVASACGGAPPGDPADGAADELETATAEAPDWTRYEVPEARLTVWYPSSWARSTEPLMPHLADPRELVSLSTFAAAPGGENCAHMPENAVEDMGATDALVVVEERVSEPGLGSGTLADFPARPAQFSPGDGYPSEAVDCLDQQKQFFDRYIPFRDSGRRFHAYVAFGTETPPEIRAQAWTILDRLDIDTRGEP